MAGGLVRGRSRSGERIPSSMTAARFRQIVSALSGTSEGAHMGHADFRLDGRVFASLDRDERWGSLKLTPAEQQHFMSVAPPVFVPASGAWGVQGWTKVDLSRADDEAVGDALTCAWQQAHGRSIPKARSAKAVVASRPRQAANAQEPAVNTPAAKRSAAKKAAAKKAVTRKAVTKKPAAKKPAAATGAGSGVAEVDAYLAATSPAVRPLLERIRSIVRRVAPKAEDVISYRMPAFRLDGMLIYYAPFKAHIGVFPPVTGDADLQAALAPYRGPKGNLRFPLDAPMPWALIRRVVLARVAEQQARRVTPRARR